ncbi:MAG: diacylglycerol kinase family lipid kinase [Anaerolineales bacterium]|nr:diacylglycerol kinase family lipid kinase [Anaerolineales bacterium]
MIRPEATPTRQNNRPARQWLRTAWRRLQTALQPSQFWRPEMMPLAEPGPRCFAIVNPVAGFGNRDEVAGAIRRALGDSLMELYLTCGDDPIDELVEDALARGATCIVAAGGDGTVAATANPLVNRPVPLGIIPLGTANVVASNLGIPTQFERAAQLILGQNRVRAIDVLEVNGQTALLSVGAGIDGAVIRSTTRVQKKRFGKLAYLKSLILEIWRADSHRLILEIDGQPLEWDGIGVMALNMQKVGVGPFSYGQNIALDDGIINVAIARLRNWRDLWLLFKGFFRGNFQEPEVMTHLPMRQKLVIDAKTPLDVQADGDLLGKTPVTVYLKPGALQVFVPADG